MTRCFPQLRAAAAYETLFSVAMRHIEAEKKLKRMLQLDCNQQLKQVGHLIEKKKKNYTWIISFLPQCFYLPKCQMERTEFQREVEAVKSSLDTQLKNTSLCFADHIRHPGDAILNRKYTYNDTLFALLWPGLMLAGGALLVVLVKLTQYLAHLSAKVRSDAAGGRFTSKGKLYRLLRRSSMTSLTWPIHLQQDKTCHVTVCNRLVGAHCE